MGILNCKRSTECKFVLLSTHFPTTSESLLENCKKNRKCHLSDFLMSLKMFKKLKNNFLYHLFLLILPNVKRVYACLTIFSLRTTTTGKRTPAAATKLQKTF